MVVLAISGPSGTGKSTIASILHCCLATEGMTVAMIGQDAYFIGPKPQSYWTQAPKESPDTVEMPALRTAVRAASEDAATDVVLVEGFLLLQDAPIMSCVDAVLFLTSDPTTCLARRLARSVRTPHESEGLRVYYKKHVWPGYLKHTQPAIAALREAVAAGVPGKPRLCEIDGTQSLEAVTAAALAALPGLLGEVQMPPRLALRATPPRTRRWIRMSQGT